MSLSETMELGSAEHRELFQEVCDEMGGLINRLHQVEGIDGKIVGAMFMQFTISYILSAAPDEEKAWKMVDLLISHYKEDPEGVKGTIQWGTMH